jgi:hypothetical protein
VREGSREVQNPTLGGIIDLEMRISLTICFVSAALAVAGLAGAATTTRKPALRVVGQTVQGRSFQHREAVRLKFAGQFELQRRVRTTAIGTFSSPLPQTYDPCNGSLIITAAGVRGDDAVLKLPQRACPPQ